MTADKPGQITLSVIIVCGFFMTLYYLMVLRIDIDQTSRELIASMIGVLSGKFVTVCDFWYSSNVGSQRTKELLAKAQPIVTTDDECLELKNEVKKP